MTTVTELQRLVRAETRRQSRRKAYGRFIGQLILNAVTVLTRGWCLMLAVSVAHTHWLLTLPTLGFWWSCLLVCLPSGLFGDFPKLNKDGAA